MTLNAAEEGGLTEQMGCIQWLLLEFFRSLDHTIHASIELRKADEYMVFCVPSGFRVGGL